MEEGLANAALNGELGYENEDTAAINWPTVDSTGEYSIYAKSKWLGWQSGVPAPDATCTLTTPADCYVVPMPGTGTVGGDTCEFTDPTQPWSSDLDDDCNWNKIEYQETVSIPLYYEDAACSDGYCNPAEFAEELNNLIIRVRVPFTGSGPGPDLDGLSTVVVKWEISGECDTTGDGVGDTACYMEEMLTGGLNSKTTAQKINTAPQYTILTEGNQIVDNMSPSFFSILIGDFLNSTTATLGFEAIDPVLKLGVIYPTTTGLGATNIPNLEYQILTNKSISGNKIIYQAEGQSEGRQGTYTRSIRASQGLESNAVVNFVIQN